MIAFFSPGQFVKHPGKPDWGIGQVQSAIADRVTVNFQHAGKQLIIASIVELEGLSDQELQEMQKKAFGED
ncbi:DUF3553 domain-containing protein [Sneathiella limimaris]|uniref:DUF3553 domain-containing protein n=1 Tax=Sneathiella limimaris TaxID=1964213 RepID=UPI00146E5DA5|nr:DUF3553 domain-containing protein [Sneathiella limimaris]